MYYVNEDGKSEKRSYGEDLSIKAKNATFPLHNGCIEIVPNNKALIK